MYCLFKVLITRLMNFQYSGWERQREIETKTERDLERQRQREKLPGFWLMYEMNNEYTY